MKDTVRKISLVIGVNILVLYALLAIVALVPPTIVDLYRLVRWQVAPFSDPRGDMPNYAKHPWAKTHFREFASLKSTYYDYVVWRRQAFSGQTIHVDERGYRRHGGQPGVNFPAARVWFFGGSTMWGYGVRDAETIPAYVQKLSGMLSFNFGESGYVAHQSLNLLMKAYLEEGRPDFVLFYDGVNEVSHKCMTGQAVYSSFYERPVRSYVDKGSNEDTGSLLLGVFSSTVKAFQLAGARVENAAGGVRQESQDLYECARNPAKVHAIAKALVDDWAAAKAIVESYGGKFIPVLQPVAYIGKPNLRHLQSVRENAVMRKNYQLVYAETKRLLHQRHLPYADFTKALDGDGLFYIDQCHVSPNGNEAVARQIASLLRDPDKHMRY